MNASESGSIVHVVDDDAAFLKSVSRLLRASGYVVRTYSSGSQFLSQMEADASGCVVIDLQMPGVNGLEVQESIARAGCAMPTIFLTGHGDIPSSVHAMRRGAEDFLTKTAPKEHLLDAVKRAMQRDARERRALAQRNAIRTRFELLTPREREVLDSVLQGKLNKQIARDLEIHERTVKLHRTSITTKLSVHSVAELTRLAQEAGVLEPMTAHAAGTPHRPALDDLIALKSR